CNLWQIGNHATWLLKSQSSKCLPPSSLCNSLQILRGCHTAPHVAGLPVITHVYLSNLALSVRAVNVLAVKFVSTTPDGKRSKCVRRWVIPVFNSSSALNSLYVNCKDATCLIFRFPN